MRTRVHLEISGKGDEMRNIAGFREIQRGSSANLPADKLFPANSLTCPSGEMTSGAILLLEISFPFFLLPRWDTRTFAWNAPAQQLRLYEERNSMDKSLANYQKLMNIRSVRLNLITLELLKHRTQLIFSKALLFSCASLSGLIKAYE